MVLARFCEITMQQVEQLSRKKGKSWLKQFASIGQKHGLSPGEMLVAHTLLPDSDRGGWHIEHHKWSDPFKESYIDQLVLAANQIKAGMIPLSEDSVRIHN